ncbi:MAG: chloride channel protein [Cytophagales bacterium]|nr:chloride channel protein [Cytophagales bacterium]
MLPEATAPLRAVVKWILLASVIGALTGLAAAGFISLVHLAVAESNHYERIFYLLPVTFCVTSLLSRFVFKNDLGTDKLIEAIDYHEGRVQQGFLPTKVINVFLILATGGSAGKESPCAQIGAGLASGCANVLKAPDADRRKMVICGASAGFACVFGAPVTGALFGIELLAVGLLQYDVLLPAFVASITAYHLSAALGITFFRYNFWWIRAMACTRCWLSWMAASAAWSLSEAACESSRLMTICRLFLTRWWMSRNNRSFSSTNCICRVSKWSLSFNNPSFSPISISFCTSKESFSESNCERCRFFR